MFARPTERGSRLVNIERPLSGSGIAFSDRGTHALKGVPDEWRRFAVE
jgi:hypothetical protein